MRAVVCGRRSASGAAEFRLIRGRRCGCSVLIVISAAGYSARACRGAIRGILNFGTPICGFRISVGSWSLLRDHLVATGRSRSTRPHAQFGIVPFFVSVDCSKWRFSSPAALVSSGAISSTHGSGQPTSRSSISTSSPTQETCRTWPVFRRAHRTASCTGISAIAPWWTGCSLPMKSVRS